MRRLLQPLWVLLALIFMIEAWLWDHLQPVIARLVAMIPLRALKIWLAARMARLSPMQTLLVLLSPLVLLVPSKFLAVWLLAHHHWIGAIALIVADKFIGVGVPAFIFDVTKPKLLQMPWFVRVYEAVLDIRRHAGEIVAPMTLHVKAMVARIRNRSSSRWMRLVHRLRSRAFARKV